MSDVYIILHVVLILINSVLITGTHHPSSGDQIPKIGHYQEVCNVSITGEVFIVSRGGKDRNFKGMSLIGRWAVWRCSVFLISVRNLNPTVFVI